LNVVKIMNMLVKIGIVLVIILGIVAYFLSNFGIINTGGFPPEYKAIKVTVIGKPSAGLLSAMVSKDARDSQIFYAGNGLKQELTTKGTLKQFDIIILQNQPACNANFQQILVGYVKDGGKLLVIGDACAYDGNTLVGWKAGYLGDIIPVQLAIINGSANLTCENGIMREMDIGHPITTGIKNFAYSGNILATTPTNTGKIISILECGSENIVANAIVENTAPFTGKVVYVAYDHQSPQAEMINLLKYIRNQKA
jgi:hypothetical protein